MMPQHEHMRGRLKLHPSQSKGLQMTTASGSFDTRQRSHRLPQPPHLHEYVDVLCIFIYCLDLNHIGVPCAHDAGLLQACMLSRLHGTNTAVGGSAAYAAPLLVRTGITPCKWYRICTSRCTSSISSVHVSLRLLIDLHATSSPVVRFLASRVVPNCPFPSTLSNSYTVLQGKMVQVAQGHDVQCPSTWTMVVECMEDAWSTMREEHAPYVRCFPNHPQTLASRHFTNLHSQTGSRVFSDLDYNKLRVCRVLAA